MWCDDSKLPYGISIEQRIRKLKDLVHKWPLKTGHVQSGRRERERERESWKQFKYNYSDHSDHNVHLKQTFGAFYSACYYYLINKKLSRRKWWNSEIERIICNSDWLPTKYLGPRVHTLFHEAPSVVECWLRGTQCENFHSQGEMPCHLKSIWVVEGLKTWTCDKVWMRKVSNAFEPWACA